jgi:hypothetical protein
MKTLLSKHIWDRRDRASGDAARPREARRLGGACGLTTLLVLAVLLTHVSGALAYFSTTGIGTAQATIATINGPSGVTAVQSGSSVTVSWSAATLSTGGAVQGYSVKRSDGTTICGSPTLVTTLSCTDSSVPSGIYTYAVTAVYNSWGSTATSAAFTVLTATTISSKPPSVSNSTSASFSFSGGNGSSYQCQVDGGAYATCTSPTSYSALSQGSHTFNVRAASGSSSGPATSYTWLVDTVPPTQSLALASGASGAYLSGSTLYYKSNAAGSFKLVDTVSDSGSGPASASFPNIATTGWTHASETITTPSGGPYTSTSFSWTATPTNPATYTVTGADVAGNSSTSSLTFVSDTTAPAGGALTVNGTAASSSGSTSQATNSTSFTIASRTDYTDSGSGLRSSVLTVQSESLSGTTCSSLGSGGPFTSATTITGSTQPPGIVAGYCYVYTLTGTDNVGNVGSITTTVVDNALSFTVTTQPTSVTAGTATASNAVVLTAIKNGATDTTYTGTTLTWSGAASSPSGTAPTLPTGPTWSSGRATFGITLVKAGTVTLTVTDGSRSGAFSAITVSPGAATQVAWANVSSPAGVPATCLFACTYSSGFGLSQTWTAYVSITDTLGNIVNALGTGHTVVVTLGTGAKGSTTPASPASFAIPSTGPAQASTSIQYTSPASGTYTDTLSAAATGYTSASASFSK